jgi:hypothetical protein
MNRTVLVGIVGALLLGALVIVGYNYMAERDARVRMEQKIEDQQQLIKESEDRFASIVTDNKEQIESLRRNAARVQTPEQAAAALSQIIRGFQPTIQPQPIVPPKSPEQPGALPPALQLPLKAEIPADQLKILYDFAEKCQECEVNLKAELAKQIELTKQLDAAKIQRDAAVSAVKGGTMLERLRRESKSAVGAGAGAAAGVAVCYNSKGPVVAACAGGGALIGFIAAHVF